MEFDNYMCKLQGALISLGSRGMLNSGSRETINILKETVQDAPEDAKLRLTFFMVLNTKLKVSEELKKDDNVGLFINVTPPIEKNYLIDYVYELNLQSHLNNIIENCQSALTLEIIETVIGKLKQPSFHKDEYGFEHLYNLWRSVFVKIYNIERSKSENYGLEKLVFCFGELFNLIESVIKTSLKISGNNLGHFIGSHFYYLFDAILLFVNLYKNEEFKYEKCELYNLTIEPQNKTKGSVKEPCWKCIKIIFNKIRKILEFLTIDSWMMLSSFYFETDSTKSMQQLIGECIYKICEAIEGLNISSDVVSCLSACKIKPKEESERIAEASIEEIISHVEKGNKEWFKGLARHPDIFEDRSITCIMNHFDLGTSEDVEFILERTFSYLQAQHSDENLDSIKKLFLTGVKKSTDFNKWLEIVFSNYKSNLLKTSTCNDELVETFNKISNESSISNCDLVCLCMQSPVETVKKICKHGACSRNTRFFIKALKTLRPACEVFQCFEEGQEPQRLLDFVLLKFVLFGDFTDKEKCRLVRLMGGLAEEKLINEEFFKKLIETLNENLEAERFDEAYFCLEIWRELADKETFDMDKHVLLVMLSQVLDHLTWDLKTFSTVKEKCRDLVALVATCYIEKLEDVDGSQLEWTRQEVSKAREINQAYFCDLWFRFGHFWRGSRKFYTFLLAHSHSHYGLTLVERTLLGFCKSKDWSQIRASIVLSFTLLLPVCTLHECNTIFRRLVSLFSDLYLEKQTPEVELDILDAFLSSLYLVSLHMNGNEGVRSCHEHCVRILGHLIKQCIDGMNPSSCVGIIEKMSFCLNAIKDDDERESCSVILSPVLLKLVDRVVTLECDKSLKEKIIRLVKVLDVKDVVEAVSQRLRD